MTDRVNELAELIAKCRAGDSVYMDGSHNPRPSEVRAAQDFVSALVVDVAEMIAAAIEERREAIGPSQVFAWSQGMTAATVTARAYARGAHV